MTRIFAIALTITAMGLTPALASDRSSTKSTLSADRTGGTKSTTKDDKHRDWIDILSMGG